MSKEGLDLSLEWVDSGGGGCGCGCGVQLFVESQMESGECGIVDQIRVRSFHHQSSILNCLAPVAVARPVRCCLGAAVAPVAVAARAAGRACLVPCAWRLNV